MSSAVSPSGVIMVPANGNSGTPASNTAPSASSGVASTSSTNSSPSGSHAVSSNGGTPSKQPQLSGPLTDSSLGLSQSMEAVNAVGEDDNQEVRSLHYHFHHHHHYSQPNPTISNQPPNPLPTRQPANICLNFAFIQIMNVPIRFRTVDSFHIQVSNLPLSPFCIILFSIGSPFSGAMRSANKLTRISIKEELNATSMRHVHASCSSTPPLPNSFIPLILYFNFTTK